MNYFKDCRTSEEVKAAYKKLALKYHPDVNIGTDTTETMKIVNEQYRLAFERLKNVHTNASGEEYTASKESEETAEEFMVIINALISMVGIKIELIGSWIWVTGDTKPHKDALKELGFKWAGQKMAWTWHKAGERKKSKNKYDMDDIRGMFGSKEFGTKQKVAIH